MDSISGAAPMALPQAVQWKMSASRRVRALRAPSVPYSPGSSRGSSVIADSGQETLHSPHCRQFFSTNSSR